MFQIWHNKTFLKNSLACKARLDVCCKTELYLLNFAAITDILNHDMYWLSNGK